MTTRSQVGSSGCLKNTRPNFHVILGILSCPKQCHNAQENPQAKAAAAIIQILA